MKPFCAHFPLGKEQGRLAYCLRPSQRLGIAHILPTSFNFPANIHANTGKAGKRREADFCSLMLNAKPIRNGCSTLQLLRSAWGLLRLAEQEGDVGSRQRHPLVVVMGHPLVGSGANFQCLWRNRLWRRNLECPYGAAVRRVHLFRLGRRVKIMRVDSKRVVTLAPSRRNSYCEVVSPVRDVPARGHIIDREFALQDIYDGDEIPENSQMDLLLISEKSSNSMR